MKITATGKKPTLVIMGTHWKGLQNFDWKRTDCEIWMFNEAPNVKIDGKLLYPKTDVVFQLHNEAIWKNPKNRGDEKHYDWLKSGNTPPIYMQEQYPDVPQAIKYPIKQILELVSNVTINIDGKESQFRYFSSSPEYALALAAHMYKEGKGYRRVEVWGIELAHESEYVYQRTGFAFWSGYLAGQGIELVLANSIFSAPMYGYEGDIAIPSETLEKRINDLTKELADGKEQYHADAQRVMNNVLGLIDADVSTIIEKDLNELTKTHEQTGILNGQINECKLYLEKALAMEKASGGSVFSMGEFDAARHIRKVEYNNVRNEIINLNTKIAMFFTRLLTFKKGSQKRRDAVNEIGGLIAEMMNKNMALLYLIGAINENHYFVESAKLSIKIELEKK